MHALLLFAEISDCFMYINRSYHGFNRHFDGLAKCKKFVVFIWGSDVI